MAYDPTSFESYLREASWATEGLVNPPEPGTVLASTPPFMMDSIQTYSFVVTNESRDYSLTASLQLMRSDHDPAGPGYVRAQSLVIPPRMSLHVDWTQTVRMGEWYRVIAVASFAV